MFLKVTGKNTLKTIFFCKCFLLCYFCAELQERCSIIFILFLINSLFVLVAV